MSTDQTGETPLERKRAFLRLPMAERRRKLAEEAERLKDYYATENDLADLQGADVIEY